MEYFSIYVLQLELHKLYFIQEQQKISKQTYKLQNKKFYPI